MSNLEQFNKDYDLELRNKLYRAALKECGNLYADDVVQKTSIIMWDKYDTYIQGTCFFAWGLSIMHYVLLNLFRGIRRSVVVQDQDKFDLAAEKMIHENDNVSYAIDLKIEQAMQQLTTMEVKLLKAVYLEGKDVKEWATENGKAPQTVFNKISTIKKKLNEQRRPSKSL